MASKFHNNWYHSSSRLAFQTKKHVTVPRLGFAMQLMNAHIYVVLCIIFYIFCLLENPLENIMPDLRLYDEIFCICLVIAALIKSRIKSTSSSSYKMKIVVITCIIILIGFFGNLVNDYQSNIEAIAKDAFSFAKFPLTIVAALSLFDEADTTQVVKTCAALSKLFVSICFLFGIWNLFSSNGLMAHDLRNGIWSFEFIYTHPTYLVFAMVMCFVMMSVQKKRLDIFKVMCIVVLLFTMRDKAFGFVGLIAALQIFDISKRKHVLPYLVVAGAVALLIVWPKISEYMSYSNSPREALYSASLIIANASFPFGGGLASVASSISGEYYSSAYYAFGMSGMEGMTPISFAAMGDAGFAYYLGEYGWVGLTLSMLVVSMIYKIVLRKLQFGAPERSGVVLLFGYLLIALTVEASLTNATGVSSAFILAVLANSHVSSIDRVCMTERLD